ncbi:MAG: LolA family protein [Flavobacterium sp.]
MKKIFLKAALFITIFTFAQDKKAQELLDEVSEKIKSYKDITLDFSYNLQNTKEKINKTSTGKVILRNNLYYLDFMQTTKIFDGKKTYTIVPEDEEVSVSKFDETDENAITPSKMLIFFKKGYTYKMDAEKTIKGKTIQYVKLIPISSKDARKEILLGIDKKTKNIYNLVETAKNNSKTTLTVNSIKTNQNIQDKQFTFDQSKYKKYYINNID